MTFSNSYFYEHCVFYELSFYDSVFSLLYCNIHLLEADFRLCFANCLIIVVAFVEDLTIF